jgi:hypothetical protein
MTKPGRLPCVNPACRRTASAEQFGDSDIICAKCFKMLPRAIRDRYQQLRRREKRLLKFIERRVLRNGIRPELVNGIEHLFAAQLAENWQLMRDYFRYGKKPLGLEGFLQEMGL